MKARTGEAAPRYLCVHGHFYQPPRENPWLESIELQDSAYPYHDWNARIDAECYAQNAASRRLDEKNRIASIVNNFERISFNVGPTLLGWMQQHAPETYRAILDADAASCARGGHGSAMAQAHGHIILPLASRRDKETQILWGMRDFQHRFGRAPEGMWLPETAVDTESLELMAEHGVRFTVLSQRQAAAARAIGDDDWHPVGARIDPSRAYVQNLPSGRSIAIFFYDGPVSQAVAFERLLDSGEGFARRLVNGFSSARTWPELMHIATDGETYGHHHRHGDMALAHALSFVQHHKLAELTTYGEFLAKHPPLHEVKIVEDSSWSCAHGIERWQADCGCCSGGQPSWNQRWRGPLREALDWLRDELAPRYEQAGQVLFGDAWAARNDYIRVVLDRSPASVAAFLREHARGDVTAEGAVNRLKLLEMQRHAMLMYTSCGWFFDDVAGIETVQVIMYAGRAVQLAAELFGVDLETELLARLALAKSNTSEGDGKRIYLKHVKPAALDLPRVAAHYAVSSLFDEYPDEAMIHCYDARSEAREVLESGRMKLGVGRAVVRSRVTHETATVSYAAIHFGDHNVAGGVRASMGAEASATMVRELGEAFQRADIAEVVRLLDRHFGDRTFSVRSLFRDEQRKLMSSLLEGPLREAGAAYRTVYERNAPVMRFLADLGMPIPRALHAAAERALNDELEALLGSGEPLEGERVRRLLGEAKERKVALDATTLEYALRIRVERAVEAFAAATDDLGRLSALEAAVGLLSIVPFGVDIWRVQNLYFQVLQAPLLQRRARAARGDAAAARWVERVVKLGESLRVRVE